MLVMKVLPKNNVSSFCFVEKVVNALDFTCPELRMAWLGYHDAIKYIQSKPSYNTPGFQKLIEGHKDKIACLERAQRIINTFNAIQKD